VERGEEVRASGRAARVKIELITGAGRGIGRATAEAFAAAGNAVVLAELRADLGRAAERSLTHTGHAALFFPTDASDAGSVSGCSAATLRRFGHIDCLVNNAGVLRIGPLAKLPMGELDRMLNVSLRGPAQVA
jgi:NAD(P)-dependent dehydrogenase (short-subunit alcohol dehydrogenase family)